jgi:hypothetical protein
MTITAKIIADSVSEKGVRITTMQLRYPRFIHSEFMTHRVFSRNASSSRAIPVKTIIEMVRKDKVYPMHWGANKKGMQATEELKGLDLWLARFMWDLARSCAVSCATILTAVGLHKQVANRILEPFSHIDVIVTSTEWKNFFDLRRHSDAQPEIQVLASEMAIAMNTSSPVLVKNLGLHLPYILDEERGQYTRAQLLKMSVARCARVSYFTHDKKTPKPEDDFKLADRLLNNKPAHASPAEHQAAPGPSPDHKSRNFVGWVQFRDTLGI